MGKVDGCAVRAGIALVLIVFGLAMIPAAIVYIGAAISEAARVLQANMAVVWVLVAMVAVAWMVGRRLLMGRGR